LFLFFKKYQIDIKQQFLNITGDKFVNADISVNLLY